MSTPPSIFPVGNMELELLDTKYLKSFKHPRVAYNGFLYNFQKECKKHIRWKCSRMNSTKCSGILRTTIDLSNLEFISIDHEHHHHKDIDAIDNLRSKIELAKQNYVPLVKKNLRKPKDKRILNHDDFINNKKQKLSIKSEEMICVPSTSKNVQTLTSEQMNSNKINKNDDTNETIRNTEIEKNIDSAVYSHTDNQSVFEVGDALSTDLDLDLDLDFDFDIDDVELNIDFDFDMALTAVGSNTNSVVDSSNEKQVKDIDIINISDSTDEEDDDENDEDDDDDINEIYCRENWPSIYKKLQNPKIGMKVFKSILMQKAKQYLTRTGSMAKYKHKLDMLKKRQVYLANKFKAIVKKLIEMEKQKERSTSKIIDINNDKVATREVSNKCQSSLKSSTNSSIVSDLTDTIITTKFDTIESSSISDASKTILPSMAVSKKPCETVTSQNANSVLQNQKSNPKPGIFTFSNDDILPSLVISKTRCETVTSQNANSVSPNQNSYPTSGVLYKRKGGIPNRVYISKRKTNISSDSNSSTTLPRQNSEQMTHSNSSVIPVQTEKTLPDIVRNSHDSETIIDLTDETDSVDMNYETISVSNLQPVPLALPILPPQLHTHRVTKRTGGRVTSFRCRPICPPMVKLNMKLIRTNKDEQRHGVCIHLTWNFFYSNVKLESPIISYELYYCEAVSNKMVNKEWTLIGVIQATSIDMSCSLDLIDIKNKVPYLSIRAKDKNGEYGPFSTPQRIPIL